MGDVGSDYFVGFVFKRIKCKQPPKIALSKLLIVYSEFYRDFWFLKPIKQDSMYKVYGDIISGNCYKVKLVMHLLDIEHEWVHVDILKGETKTENFKQINPNGKIPSLELPDGRFLWESNAILNYLAAGSNYLPNEAFEYAKVLQWQFFEQYSHEPYIATARFISK